MSARDASAIEYAVIYDGNCGICTRLVMRLRKLDRRGRLEILASQTAGVRERFPWIDSHAYDESIQLVRKSDGETWQGAAAVERIIDALRAGWAVSWIFSIPFARPIAERLYRWFADHRGQLGCGDHCQIQTIPPGAGAKNS